MISHRLYKYTVIRPDGQIKSDRNYVVVAQSSKYLFCLELCKQTITKSWIGNITST